MARFLMPIILVVGILLFGACGVPKSAPETQPASATMTDEQPTQATVPGTSLVVNLTETYANSIHGISIKYSPDWKIKEGSGKLVVAFFTPKENDSDILQENLNIMIEDLSENPMTLSEYTELGINQLKKDVANFQIIDSSSATLAGNPARKLVYSGLYEQYYPSSGKFEEYPIKVKQIWTIRNNHAYVVSYPAEVHKYNDYIEIIEDMIDSFVIDE